MIIGKTHRSYPTVQIPPHDIVDDPTANIHFPFSVNDHSNADVLTALQRYLPSNMNTSPEIDDYDVPIDAFTSDHFRIYEFKVKRCARARSHDWIECPYAHPGEKARRRDPRKFCYSGTPCPEYKKGLCARADACEYAHGVFECWLHPTRYRTQPCKDGILCRRKICFFAHTAEQLRLPTPSSPRKHGEFDSESQSRLGGSLSQLGTDLSMHTSPSSPRYNNGFVTELDNEFHNRLGMDSLMHQSFGLSPRSTLYSMPTESPPLSPRRSTGFNSASELSESIRGLQIGQCSRMSMSPPSRGVQKGSSSSYGSPRQCSILRPGLTSLPVTPTRKLTRSGLGEFDMWDDGSCEEEPAMERVESGRDVRAKMYAKLSKENSIDRVDSTGSGYNVGWVSELVK